MPSNHPAPPSTNRLTHETSPYLLHHATNPVDWYAWKPEAFERARRENKPILVSIGYHTCHWCHVMERESFTDPQIAVYMNEHYVNIKVDREERPDVDAIYMEAVQILTGHGGWPLNAFLTPEGKPFYAGTYFPPEPRYNRPSWMNVLEQLARLWREQPEKIQAQAEQLTAIIAGSEERVQGLDLPAPRDEDFNEQSVTAVFEGMRGSFDTQAGGFGRSPKFPGALSLKFLLDYHHHTGNRAALDHVEFSLRNMTYGGIYDQLGGGFARYATDREWLVPHFEKMLYDNALLIRVLSDAYRITKNEEYRRIVEETVDWLAREMTHPEGGFYAAQDADSEGVEGKFYVWSAAEIDELLGDGADLFKTYYQVSEHGNWEGSNILHPRQSIREFAEREGISQDDLTRRFAGQRATLFAAREQRIRPDTDDKILLDWNALMIAALYDAATAFARPDYAARARAALDFCYRELRDSEGFFHVYRDGKRQYAAYLDDYAFLIEAHLKAYEYDGRSEDLLAAETWTEFVLKHFGSQGPLLYFAPAEKDLIARRIETTDGVTPSGNATMILVLQSLAVLRDRPEWRTRARSMLVAVREELSNYPTSFARFARAWLRETEGLREVGIVGKEAQDIGRRLQAHFLPNTLFAPALAPDATGPLTDRPATADGTTAIYVCENFVCKRPVTTIGAALDLLKESS